MHFLSQFFLISILCFYSNHVFSNDKSKNTSDKKKADSEHEHHHHNEDKSNKRKHGAHEHGTAKISVGVDGKRADIDFEIPGHDVYGFENPKPTEEQKKKIQEKNDLIKSKIQTLVKIDEKLQCVVQLEKIDLENDADEKSSGHNEVDMEAQIICPNIIANTTIQLDTKELFPSLQQAKIQVVTEHAQFSETLKDGKASIKIEAGKAKN